MASACRDDWLYLGVVRFVDLWGKACGCLFSEKSPPPLSLLGHDIGVGSGRFWGHAQALRIDLVLLAIGQVEYAQSRANAWHQSVPACFGGLPGRVIPQHRAFLLDSTQLLEPYPPG